MSTKWETFPIPLKGGLITNLGRLEQGLNAPGSATILENYEPDVKGGYTRILGYTKFSTTPVTGTGAIFGVIALDNGEVLTARNGQFYYSAGTTWTAKLALTSGSITRIRSARYNFTGTTKTIVVDGVNAPAYFNHTAKTMAYAGSPPSDVVGASIVRVFKNHIFFAKDRILSFTAPYLESDWTPANGAGSINVGSIITGLIVFRDQLIVFCVNSIHVLSGSSLANFALAPIASNTGCLNGDTIQEVGGDIMYLGPDGVRYLSASERINDFGLTRASEKIQTPLLATIKTTDSFSSVTVASKNQYRLFCYTTANAPDLTISYLAMKVSNQTVEDISWAQLRGIKVFSCSKFQDSLGEFIVFSSDTGYIYKMESGNSFDGADIPSIFETPFMAINDPKIRKSFYKHTLYAFSPTKFNVTATLKFDYGQIRFSLPMSFNVSANQNLLRYGGGAIYGTAIYAEPLAEVFYNNVIGSGFTAALRYQSKSQDDPYNLNFVVLEHRPHERR